MSGVLENGWWRGVLVRDAGGVRSVLQQFLPCTVRSALDTARRVGNNSLQRSPVSRVPLVMRGDLRAPSFDRGGASEGQITANRTFPRWSPA